MLYNGYVLSLCALAVLVCVRMYLYTNHSLCSLWKHSVNSVCASGISIADMTRKRTQKKYTQTVKHTFRWIHIIDIWHKPSEWAREWIRISTAEIKQRVNCERVFVVVWYKWYGRPKYEDVVRQLIVAILFANKSNCLSWFHSLFCWRYCSNSFHSRWIQFACSPLTVPIWIHFGGFVLDIEQSSSTVKHSYIIDASASRARDFCNKLSTDADDHIYVKYTAHIPKYKRLSALMYVYVQYSRFVQKLFWFRITMPSHLMFQTEQFTVWTFTHRARSGNQKVRVNIRQVGFS